MFYQIILTGINWFCLKNNVNTTYTINNINGYEVPTEYILK